jgi:manganese/zinc/iron transport system permease protein
MMFDYTLVIILIGITILGVTAGLLGTFVFLRRQSLLGDAISHAALPGIAIAFLLTHSKNPLVLMLGGAISGGIGTVFMQLITRNTRLKKDTALGIVLSVFFGFGLVLMTAIQKMPIANQSILNKFLFGNISTLLPTDVYAMGIIGAIICVCTILLWKEFALVTFDLNFAHSVGFATHRLDNILTMLIVAAIVIGLQTVGVILMSSMLIAPAAAARQWTTRLRSMALLSIFFAVSAGIIGALVSSHADRLPTGPAIVVVLSSFVLCSLLCAPMWCVVKKKLYNAR